MLFSRSKCKWLRFCSFATPSAIDFPPASPRLCSIRASSKWLRFSSFPTPSPMAFPPTSPRLFLQMCNTKWFRFCSLPTPSPTPLPPSSPRLFLNEMQPQVAEVCQLGKVSCHRLASSTKISGSPRAAEALARIQAKWLVRPTSVGPGSLHTPRLHRLLAASQTRHMPIAT